MTVYVDQCLVWGSEGNYPNQQAENVGKRHKHKWCHMWSDNLNELHSMASKIGLRRNWFQDRPNFPHYDLVPTKRELAVQNGAVELDVRELVKLAAEHYRKLNSGSN